MRHGAAALSGVLLAGLAVAACSPNPRNEIPALVSAAMTEAARTEPALALCVDRTIAPWQPADAANRRRDPPAPPGFEHLYTGAVFRGGGGIKGVAVGGVVVRSGPRCFDLRGPLVDGDRAMVEVHVPGIGIGWNVWMQRSNGVWRPVMTTTSTYME